MRNILTMPSTPDLLDDIDGSEIQTDLTKDTFILKKHFTSANTVKYYDLEYWFVHTKYTHSQATTPRHNVKYSLKVVSSQYYFN